MKRSFLTFFLILLWLLPLDILAYTSKDCIGCHRVDSKESVLLMSIEEFRSSSHGIEEITCEECHVGVKDEAHETLKGSGAVDCDECHDQDNRHGSGSKNEDRPKCHSCHGKHDIYGKDDRASRVHSEQLKETCRECHPVECGETDYLSWIPSIRIVSHKKQDFSQDYEKDNCVGCHQGEAAHGEERPIDEQKCHVCHMKMKDHGPIMGYIHARADSERQPVIFAAATFYQIIIILLLWGVFRFYVQKLSGKIRNRGE